MQVDVVGIRFKPAGKILQYATNGLGLQRGDKCVAESQEGLEIATVVLPPRQVDSQMDHALKPIVRLATAEDIEQAEAYKQLAREALVMCQRQIQEVHLPMKLTSVEYMLDGQRAVFYYTAEQRVDFRGLVRYLAGKLKRRIEMRQISPRDEAKQLGGYGVCGRPLCCASFLTEFAPISVRMAKEQGVSLNPSRISGVCGRLKCCLAYEMPVYRAITEAMPCLGDTYMTPQGPGRVTDITVVREAFAVELEDGEVVFIRLPSAEERTHNCTGGCGQCGKHDTQQSAEP